MRRNRRHSLLQVRVRLGHKHANITDVYAEVSREKAAELAHKLG
jgi:hypothetical protein